MRLMQKLIIFLLLFISFNTIAQTRISQQQERNEKGGQNINQADFFQNNKMNYYDIKHLKLDVMVEPKSKFIAGNCSYTVLVTQTLDTFAIEFKQTMTLDSVY